MAAVVPALAKASIDRVTLGFRPLPKDSFPIVGFPERRPDVYVTVRATDALEGFSANLYAPILISGGRGHQVINQTADAPVRAPLFERPATEGQVQAA